MRNVVAEHNAIGYYGTNASGNVFVIESTFRNNRLGLAPNSQKAEKLSPQGESTIAGNTVIDNDDPSAPHVPNGFFGGGIAVGGGTRNLILRNLITGHDFVGIIVITLNDFLPEGNRIEGNVLKDNQIDMAYAPQGASDGGSNCFIGNAYSTSAPDDIEDVLPCSETSTVTGPATVNSPPPPPKIDYRSVPAPPPQESMGPEQLKIRPASPVFVAPDLASITVPTS